MNDKKLYILFNDLQQMLSAGIPLIKSLENIANSNYFNEKTNSLIRKVIKDIENGKSFAISLLKNNLTNEFLSNLIKTGEQSGKLPEILNQICFLLQRNIQFKKKIITSMVYPIFLLHFAIILMPLYIIFQNCFTAYIYYVATRLVIVYIILIILYFILKPSFKSIDSFYFKLPLIGKFLKSYTLFKFYLSFYSLYNSGLNLKESFIISYNNSNSNYFKNNLKKSFLSITKYNPLEDSIHPNIFIPIQDLSILITGEKTGKLEESLQQLLKKYEEESNYYLKIIEKVIPKIFYILVAIFIAWKIVTFYISYFNRILKLM